MSANPHMRMSPMRVAIGGRLRARATGRARGARGARRSTRTFASPSAKATGCSRRTSRTSRSITSRTCALAIRERFKFDPAQPSSLLYKKDPDGSLRLVGAMYTAPKDATAGRAQCARAARHRAMAPAHEHVRAEADADALGGAR